jgi:hypothetical protein
LEENIKKRSYNVNEYNVTPKKHEKGIQLRATNQAFQANV